jgi:hypothetical protein
VRLAVYTAAYPAALPFGRDWCAGLAAQADRNFRVCVALDGVAAGDVRAAAGEHAAALDGADWLDAPEGVPVALVRDATLARAVQNYDALVLSDIDDAMLPGCVAAARAALADGADLAAWALALADARLAPTGPTLTLHDGFSVVRENVLGLGNTAWRAPLLSRVLGAPDDCPIYDWRLATLALGLGAAWTFDPTPRALYRQHGANVARLLPPFDAAGVRAASRLVRDHLAHMDRDWSAFCKTSVGTDERLAPALGKRLAEVESFLNTTTRDRDAMDGYLEALNALPPRHVWWSCVAHPKLESTWKRSGSRSGP